MISNLWYWDFHFCSFLRWFDYGIRLKLTGFAETLEQQKIKISAAEMNLTQTMIVKAYAATFFRLINSNLKFEGCGKTSTIKISADFARLQHNKGFVYFAFNRGISSFCRNEIVNFLLLAIGLSIVNIPCHVSCVTNTTENFSRGLIWIIVFETVYMVVILASIYKQNSKMPTHPVAYNKLNQSYTEFSFSFFLRF